jgi:hypothetical protein
MPRRPIPEAWRECFRRRGHDSLAELRVGPDDQGIGVRVVEDGDRHDMRHPVSPDRGDPAQPLTVHKLDLGIGERAHGSSVCRLPGPGPEEERNLGRSCLVSSRPVLPAGLPLGAFGRIDPPLGPALPRPPARGSRPDLRPESVAARSY